jgi:phage anti-repressor protein
MIGIKQWNTSAYADDIVLIEKNEIEIRQFFLEMEKTARKLGLETI